ncbi:Clp protease N-terminal domain-containing protein [Bacillus sp. 1P06AnD]|uniref:Clp protease N-terminal domain-containing protein n=1 Tax=Bacillus sp. 1P06AnD TaxID=3132208 RepID=UPI0039A0B66D
MSAVDVRFTERMERIWQSALWEGTQAGSNELRPVHMLLALLEEKTGVLGEISLRISSNAGVIRRSLEIGNKGPTNEEPAMSAEALEIIGIAKKYREHYNQSYLNEGHLLKALICSRQVDTYLTAADQAIMLELGTTSRDMVCRLSILDIDESIIGISRAVRGGLGRVVSFCRVFFFARVEADSGRWMQTESFHCLYCSRRRQSDCWLCCL